MLSGNLDNYCKPFFSEIYWMHIATYNNAICNEVLKSIFAKKMYCLHIMKCELLEKGTLGHHFLPLRLFCVDIELY
jgi:hypothetical protein